ncbi:fumarylacetoacetate hydrolase family protein [Yoonia sp. 2307UL14-13]
MLDSHDGATLDGPPEAFDPDQCCAPLPRASAFLDGSAYVNHVALVRQARGAEMPERFWTDPLMYQGCSDRLLSPHDPIEGKPEWGMDFEAEIGVITDFVDIGASVNEAAAAIRYIVLLNDISLRALIPDELSKGFGFVQSKPPSAFAPMAIRAEDWPGWDGRKLTGTVCVDLNGQPFGRTRSEDEMTFDFAELIAHAAKTRYLEPGTIIGSGTVSNRDADGPGKTIAQGGRGYSCIAEQRMVETILNGRASTPFLQAGDQVDIWFEDDNGNDIFGRISQKVELI